MKVVTTNFEHINTLIHRLYPNMACNLLIFGLLTFLPSAITSSIIVNNGNNNGFRASDYLNLGSTNGHRDVPHCPNITRNSRLKCAQSLDVQACGCYVKAYRRWLNSSVSVSHEKASCCSKLEVRNCVERLLRNEKRDCKPRWEKEAKRYTELVLPLKEYSCRDYRKQEYCKLESINLTLIILLITVALLAIIACLGFTGYACYRRYNE